jgi:hypothetical protein
MNAIEKTDAKLQASQMWRDYGHSVQIASRNVADLAGLVGESGGSQIGQLERQNMLLGRQSQLLSFQQQQRQINFSVAASKFLAPGLTGEERAANIAEAKARANVGQKQLNIAEKMGANQFQITELVNKRALDDARYELTKLKQDMKIAVKLDLDKKSLTALDERRQAIVADLGVFVNTGNTIISAMSSYQAQLESQSTAFYTDLAKKVQDTFLMAGGYVTAPTGPGGVPGEHAVPGADQGVPGTGNTGTTAQGIPFNVNPKKAAGGGGGGAGQHPSAAGTYGLTQGPTGLLVGEAGGEAVAILKNPRQMLMGGGGGGGGGVNITVNVTGNSVRDDRDLDVLASRITESVITKLGRKASLQGLRSP